MTVHLRSQKFNYADFSAPRDRRVSGRITPNTAASLNARARLFRFRHLRAGGLR